MQEKTQRLKLYHRGHLEGNRYVFCNNSSDEDGDSEEDQHPLKLYKQEPFLEREVQPGDTLQTLALQFNCPIAELKRINNIHRDNEVFARRTIKIPARLFTRKLPGVHTSLSHKVTSEARSGNCTNSDSSSDSLINDMSASSHVMKVEMSNTMPKDVSSVPTVEFLVDDATRVYGTNRTTLETLDVERSTSPLIQHENSNISSDDKSMYSCNGADWGLTWLQLLICSLLLGFAGPVLYVIYTTEDKPT